MFLLLDKQHYTRRTLDLHTNAGVIYSPFIHRGSLNKERLGYLILIDLNNLKKFWSEFEIFIWSYCVFLGTDSTKVFYFGSKCLCVSGGTDWSLSLLPKRLRLSAFNYTDLKKLWKFVIAEFYFKLNFQLYILYRVCHMFWQDKNNHIYDTACGLTFFCVWNIHMIVFYHTLIHYYVSYEYFTHFFFANANAVSETLLFLSGQNMWPTLYYMKNTDYQI